MDSESSQSQLFGLAPVVDGGGKRRRTRRTKRDHVTVSIRVTSVTVQLELSESGEGGKLELLSVMNVKSSGTESIGSGHKPALCFKWFLTWKTALQIH